MLRLGVQLYEISSVRTRRSVRLGLFGTQIGRLHAKAAVIDGRTLFVGSMNFDPRSEIHNTEIGLIVSSPELAQQVLRLVGELKQQGSYKVQFAPGADERLQWVGGNPAAPQILESEPDATFKDHLMLELLAPFAPESLL
jgi:phosphatidylserine/phosphatidylglycerophosphate/cardiolipin synthase-like enzyme